MSPARTMIMLAVASVLLATPAFSSLGDKQFACAYSAALTQLQAAGTVNSLYQTWFSSSSPSWMTACTTTWQSCDCAFGASPTAMGTLARIFQQHYVVLGANVSPPRTVTIGAAQGSNPGGSATGYYPDLATAIFNNIANHYGQSALAIYWKDYPFSAPFDNNLQYWLNQNSVDMSWGNAVINGTFLTANGTVPRASLVQFPTCPYSADSDSIVQGKTLALPAGVANPLTVEALMSASAVNVTVCGQSGTTYSTQFAARGFMATLVTQPNLLDCYTLVRNGTVHASYSPFSSAQLAASAAPADFYSPIAVHGSEFNAFPFFRLDSTQPGMMCSASAIGGSILAILIATATALSLVF